MSQFSSESDDQVLRYWGFKSELNNSVLDGWIDGEKHSEI